MPIGDFDISPEIPTDPRIIWLIGKFIGYRTLLSASQRSVYTEIDFQVEHVFRRPNIPSLTEGTTIQIERAGGTIIAPWGGAIAYALRPEKHDFKPGRTYLISAGYHAVGNFYTAHGAHRRWDLTDGICSPDTFTEIDRAARGQSQLSGLGKAALVEKLDRLLTEGERNGR